MRIPADCVATSESASPSPSPVPNVYFVFLVEAFGSKEDTEASTIDPWGASFLDAASYMKIERKSHGSAFSPRGRNSVLRTAQVC